MNPLGIQLVILGSGDRTIEETLSRATQGSSAIQVRLAFDQALAHRIYAGADAFLMPSRYEPCGLGQMIAMRYGTVPIVRSTGGLTDTVSDWDSSRGAGNGFCFRPYESQSLVEAIRRALTVYQDPLRWEAIQHRGMKSDFSWGRSAGEYLRLYEELIRKG
jgi:starch synthase